MKKETIEEFLARGGEVKKSDHSEAYKRKYTYAWKTKSGNRVIHDSNSILANRTLLKKKPLLGTG